MSAQHTPGPWAANFTDTPYAEIGEGWVVDADAGSVCTLDGPAKHREADARLIAAAPDLLDALKNFDDWFASFNPDDKHDRMVGRKVVIAARAALSRALGEGERS